MSTKNGRTRMTLKSFLEILSRTCSAYKWNITDENLLRASPRNHTSTALERYCPLTCVSRFCHVGNFDTDDYKAAAESLNFSYNPDVVVNAADDDVSELDTEQTKRLRRRMMKALGLSRTKVAKKVQSEHNFFEDCDEEYD